MSRYIFYSIRLECPKNLNAFYMYQDTVQYHCTALVDVSDSKCVSSAITTVMHVKHLHMVGVFNSGHRYSRNCHFHCFTRKNKRAAHRPPNIISIAQRAPQCPFSFYQKSIVFSYGTSHLENFSNLRYYEGTKKE